MASYIVVRRTVDWQRFDPAESAPFLRSQMLPETLIVEFCALWAQQMRVSYQDVRLELNRIARRSWDAVSGACVITADELRAMALRDDDRILFTDDDDWFSPETITTPLDAVWGSVLISKFVEPPPGVRDEPLMLRPFTRVVYTNNASISGATLKRLGLARLFDHVPADRARRWFRFRPRKVQRYLSCAVKHPCATTSVYYNMKSEGFARSIGTTVEAFVEALAEPLPSEVAWIAPYRTRLRDVFLAALGR